MCRLPERSVMGRAHPVCRRSKALRRILKGTRASKRGKEKGKRKKSEGKAPGLSLDGSEHRHRQRVECFANEDPCRVGAAGRADCCPGDDVTELAIAPGRR